MTRADRFPPASPSSAALRIGAALSLSLLAHWALLAVPPAPEAVPQRAAVPAGMPLTARLRAAAETPAMPVREEGRAPQPAAPVESADRRGDSAAPVAAAALAVRGVPDPVYYAAHELDSYPRPVAPLHIAWPDAPLRLVLSIDEHGAVNDVAPAQDDGPRLGESLRAALGATRFVPARKDGRDVKSRLLLNVGPHSESER